MLTWLEKKFAVLVLSAFASFWFVSASFIFTARGFSELTVEIAVELMLLSLLVMFVIFVLVSIFTFIGWFFITIIKCSLHFPGAILRIGGFGFLVYLIELILKKYTNIPVPFIDIPALISSIFGI